MHQRPSSPCAANHDLPLITAACWIGRQDGEFASSPARCVTFLTRRKPSAQKHLPSDGPCGSFQRIRCRIVGLVRNVLLSAVLVDAFAAEARMRQPPVLPGNAIAPSRRRTMLTRFSSVQQ